MLNKKSFFNTILLIEIIIFSLIIISHVLRAIYVSDHPFFESSRGDLDFNISTTWEKILSQIIINSSIINTLLFFAFPFIYIFQIIIYKTSKYKSKKRYFIILIPLYLICALFALGDIISPASYYQTKIYSPHSNFDIKTFNSLDTLDLIKHSRNDSIWFFYENSTDKIEVSKIPEKNNDSIFFINYLPEKGIYQYHQYRYFNGKIKSKGYFLNTFKIDKWNYYDENGDSIIVDETAKHPFMYTYADLLYLMHSKEHIDIFERDEFEIRYCQKDKINGGNPYWHVTLQNSISKNKEVLLYDARTGRRIKE